MNQLDTSYVLAQSAVATTDYSCTPFALNGVKEYSLQVVFSSAGLNGTLQLQASDVPTAVSAVTNADWVNVSCGSKSVINGATHMWNVLGAAYKYVRFTWTRSSGTGTMTAHLELKYLQG